jgi:hypothetical protein
MPDISPDGKFSGRMAHRFTDLPSMQALVQGGANKQAGRILDVSETGAFVREVDVPAGLGVITISRHRHKPITKACAIIRSSSKPPTKWAAVKFQSPLSQYELAVVNGTDAAVPGDLSPEAYDIACSDYDVVSRELESVKACRSTILLWTLSAVGAIGMALWTFFADSKFTALAVFIGSTVVLGAFFVGALCAVEKARAINLRRGFLTALSPYLAHRAGPRDYAGWHALRHCFEECGARRRLGVCDRNLDADSKVTCRDEGESAAAALNSAKRLVPGAVESFTSLSTTIFGLLYVTTISLFGLALAQKGQDWWNVSVVYAFMVFLTGTAASTLIVRFRKLIFGALAGFLVSLGIGVFHPAATWGLISAFALGLCLGSLGWYLLRQLSAIRSGRFSFETNVYAWHTVLKHCHRTFQEVSDASPFVSRRRSERWLRAALLWIVNERPPAKTREDFRIVCEKLAPRD